MRCLSTTVEAEGEEIIKKKKTYDDTFAQMNNKVRKKYFLSLLMLTPAKALGGSVISAVMKRREKCLKIARGFSFIEESHLSQSSRHCDTHLHPPSHSALIKSKIVQIPLHSHKSIIPRLLLLLAVSLYPLDAAKIFSNDFNCFAAV